MLPSFLCTLGARLRSLLLDQPVRLWLALWVLIILTGEVFVFWSASSHCLWPEAPAGAIVTGKILVIADPQLTDAYSYGQSGLLLSFIESLSDAYMRKSYGLLTASLQPPSILFLGDLFDGGREWKETPGRWTEELDRFNHIFPLTPAETDRIWAGGNHDYGFGDAVLLDARVRFEEHFSSPNSVRKYGNASELITLDTVSLSSERREEVYGPSRQFLHSFNSTMTNASTAPLQRILISHVPLYRPNDAGCGRSPRTSHWGIVQNSGYQYQNLILEPLSQDILHSLHPALILSGDDHDQCERFHEIPEGDGHKALEYTAGTFSFMQGNLVPSASVLLIYETPSASGMVGGFEYGLCLFPNQLGTYLAYGILAAVALLHLAIVGCLRLSRTEGHEYAEALQLDPDAQEMSPMKGSALTTPLDLEMGTHSSPEPPVEGTSPSRRRYVWRWISHLAWDVVRIIPLPLAVFLFLLWWYM